MPDFETHLSKYKHNKNFVRYGLNQTKEKFDDWEIIGDFYACIHLLEAILYKKFQEDPGNHDQRLSQMHDHPNVFSRDLKNKYTSLKNLAWTARYKGMLETQDCDAHKAQEYLEDIELELRSYIE